MLRKTNLMTNRQAVALRPGRVQQLSLLAVALAFSAALLATSCKKPDDAPSAQASGNKTANSNQSAQTATTSQATQGSCAPIESAGGPDIQTLNVNTAVMVTEELDFGTNVPSIAEALRDIQRCYRADDGSGQRTFAILDAYGEPTSDGKLLHISMHVSTEKPGTAMLVFKRTGKVLWRCRINPTTEAPKQKNLLILIDNGGGRSITVDGSNNPPTVLEANAKELGKPVKDAWADGTEREVTFVYSACGCPVKVMTRRVGNKTVRTSDKPVIFPDDPAAVQVISKLMGWQ
jgi:hypothetical protein